MRRLWLELQDDAVVEPELDGAAPGDPEPAQDLGGRQVLGQQPAAARLVVVWHERPHELHHLVDGLPRDCGQPPPHHLLAAGGADRMQTVGEVVEAERVDVQRPRVLIEGEDGGVPVALARHRRQAHQADDELIPIQVRRGFRERFHLGTEGLARHVVEEIGVRRLHRVGEPADLALQRVSAEPGRPPRSNP